MDLKIILDNIKKYEDAMVLLTDLNKVKYSESKNQMVAKKYIAEQLERYIENNIPIPAKETIAIHFLITKLSLNKVGLNGTVGLAYSNKTQEETNIGASYSHTDNAITIFTEDVLNSREFLSPYGKSKDLGRDARLDYLTHLIFVLEHEIQHAVQFTRINNQQNELYNMTKSDYITAIQHAARNLSISLSKWENSTYFSETLSTDRLYKDNHDRFYYEIDADIHAYERTLEILHSISPRGYKLAIEKNKYKDKLNQLKTLLNKYEETVCWTHNTNINGIDIPAVHKASLVFDEIIPLLDKNNLAACFNFFPVLKFTYNLDGTKKTLSQIETERDNKIRELYLQNDKSNFNIKKSQILNLYNTIIDCDPKLCYEKRQILLSNLQDDGIKYYIDGGLVEQYSKEELERMRNKIIQRMTFIESYLDVNDTHKKKS